MYLICACLIFNLLSFRMWTLAGSCVKKALQNGAEREREREFNYVVYHIIVQMSRSDGFQCSNTSLTESHIF